MFGLLIEGTKVNLLDLLGNLYVLLRLLIISYREGKNFDSNNYE